MITVVFLHGLFGRPADFARVRTFLQGRVRTVALDLPIASGRGTIDSVGELVEFVSRQLDESGAERLVLVGNSLGGHVAIRMAVAAPNRIAGMVLSGSSGLFERGLERGIPRRPKRTWVAGKIAEVFHDPAFVTDAVVDETHAILHDRRRYRSVVHLARSAKQEDLAGVLPTVLAPTLLLWGTEDRITPPDTAREFERLLPHARLIFLPACGHAPMLERPRRFAFHVSAFLRDLSPVGRLQAPKSGQLVESPVSARRHPLSPRPELDRARR
jgi:pimeloyl-ACP methyl ester carboxylesterase